MAQQRDSKQIQNNGQISISAYYNYKLSYPASQSVSDSNKVINTVVLLVRDLSVRKTLTA